MKPLESPCDGSVLAVASAELFAWTYRHPFTVDQEARRHHDGEPLGRRASLRGEIVPDSLWKRSDANFLIGTAWWLPQFKIQFSA
ncbi:MAG TPA: hypothetical protein VGE52_18615 [Pirellulales bacterium]